ncbi:G3BP2-like protein [Mya arenaria]|uniref:G3BP2-like protein n=1 Tax=Mya arenaria TaxID=6604 RepID=A0ABY7DGQ3_MYAAR|nr:ras GTPase-activating protein-binding protein 2-like [Mya arenaria]XP_052766680.1 ras GTPase-activating protein-binding protein 2-like [Mya arenaria]WAQ96871.1 G3BP2-like protein [Mya arenaria]
MVMETPSPQCVGREFVRQYYTLLHEAPLHLHRFYSHNSSFVHGGVEKPGEEQPPVIGQPEIHKKIMCLDFRDCHAKIRQVDSQATVGNAVVVQVTGELSNNGQPMRRFMQTFVLAPQSPKKYYVHNDIFRYQDEVFHDNDTDTEILEDAQDSEGEIVEPVDVGQTADLIADNQQFYEPHAQPLSNGTGLLEEEPVEMPPSPKSEPEEPLESKEPVQMEAFEPVKEEPKVEQPEEPQQIQEEPRQNKPFSWAAMASKNTMGAPAPVSQMPVQTQAPPKPAPGFGTRQDMKQDTSPTAPKEQRAPRGGRDRPDRGRDRDRMSMGREDGEVGDRRGTRYPDSHQLFVGNLPHNVSEKELKAFFEEYGSVVELRINTKSGSGKVPNFGFVVFESNDPVDSILKKSASGLAIKLHDHRLNVEEKKPRGGDRTMGRGPPPRSGSAGGMGGGGFNSRGGSAGRGMGPRGGSSGMREGGRGGGSGNMGPRGGGGGMSGPRR